MEPSNIKIEASHAQAKNVLNITDLHRQIIIFRATSYENELTNNTDHCKGVICFGICKCSRSGLLTETSAKY